MMKPWRLTVDGTANDGQTWTTCVDLMCEFEDVMPHGMPISFQQLTGGKAQYGKPGQGCKGPYDIHKVVIEQIKQ